MKKVLLSLLGILLVLGVLAGAGFAGYRFGYDQGSLATSDGTTQVTPWGSGWNRQIMPMHNFGRGFDRSFGPGGYPMMGYGGMGFGFFSPFMFMGRILFWALIIWLAYWLFTKSGWKFSMTRQETNSIQAEPEGKQD